MNSIVWAHEVELELPLDFEERLLAKLCGRVESAYIFGSYGTEDFRPGSDVDLILVVETELPFVERPRLFRDLYGLYPKLDLLVYQKKELEALLSESTGFWASVRASIRPLEVGALGNSV